MINLSLHLDSQQIVFFKTFSLLDFIFYPP
jgi:hypothetical protein